MRILSIIEVLGGGGAETVLVDLVRGLTGHEHVVWHLSRSNSLPVHEAHLRRLRSAGTRVRDVNWRVLADPVERASALEGFEPDVVVCHWWGNDPWAPWLAAPAPAPALAPAAPRPAFVCMAHDSRRPLKSGFDRYVLVAEAQRPQVRHVTSADVRVIPNAVDLERFGGRARAASSRAGQPFAVGTLAGLRPGKVPADWTHTVAGWDVPGARFLVAGDGALRRALEADAVAFGRAADFRFLGQISRHRVPRFLRSLDVLCHLTGPETVECCPVAVIEALAAGVPVVALARGGITELVDHGHNGLLATDTDDLGRQLHRLATERSRVRRLALGALRSRARFGRPAQLTAFSQLLADLVPGAMPARAGAA